MSDILTGIKQRLSTDIGDLARASIDPTFSRQLTEANFRDKELAQQRQDAILKRQQALADKEKEQKFDIQKTILMGAHQRALDDPTGKIVSPSWMDFMKVGKHLEDPKLQQAWGILAEGVGGRSAEANQTIFDNVLNLEKDMRDKVKFEYSEENRARNELVYDKWDNDYQAMQDKLNAQNFDRQGLIGLLRGSYGVFDEDQKNNIISAMTEATSDQEAKNIYNTAINAGNSAFQEKRNLMAFPQYFGPEEQWVNEEGVVLGTKQFNSKIKQWVYRDDPSKRGPLVDMSAKEFATDAFKKMEATEKSAEFARKMIDSIQFLEATIGDIDTGSLTKAKVSFNRFLTSMGLPASADLALLEAGETATGDIGMQLLDNFPGQISNAEREFVIQIAPGLSQTKEGRRLVSEFWKRKAKRAIAREQIMSEYMQGPSPNMYPQGKESFNVRWQRYRDENPAYEDMPLPPGESGKLMAKRFGLPRTAADLKTQTKYYLSFDGQYRDKSGNVWTPVTETIDPIPGAQ